VTVLLKECRDIQLRCGSSGHDQVDNSKAIAPVGMGVESDPENAILERLVSSPLNFFWKTHPHEPFSFGKTDQSLISCLVGTIYLDLQGYKWVS
jgi:hypothetical protein